MAKKTSRAKQATKKRVKSVTKAEQNPAAVDVRALADVISKRKKKRR
jgi:hypothetical protein